MVEVFVTNVEGEVNATSLVSVMLKSLPNSRITFDLDDCDRILRVEGENISQGGIISMIESHGWTCRVLE